MNIKYIKSCFIFIATLCISCSSDNTLHRYEDLSVQSDQKNHEFRTVPIEYAKNYFENFEKDRLKNENILGLNILTETSHHEELTNSDADLLVTDAQTNFDNVYTEILQLEINGSIQTVLFHSIPDKRGALVTDDFTGGIIITDILGTVLNTFSYQDGLITSGFTYINVFSSDPECGFPGSNCSIQLEEVIVTESYVPPIYWTNYVNWSANDVSAYNWNRHINSYSSMGQAFASYYQQLSDIESLEDIELAESGDKLDPKKDISDCFDLAIGAELTIYVEQPKENSNAVIGPNQVGHVFVGLQQNEHHRVFGFYPETGASELMISVGSTYQGELRDNSGSPYHVSISTNINSTQLSYILNYVQNSFNYNVNSYACADFGIIIGNYGGLNLSSTSVNYVTFNGRSPGQLGQEIRQMNSGNGVTVETEPSNAPNQSDPCN